MSTISNSFTIDPIKGQLTFDPSFQVLSCQVDSNETGTLVAGQAVVIVDTAGAQIPVEAVSAATDDIFGVVVASFKVNEYEALDNIKVAISGSTVYMEASAAIARGADVQVVVSGSKVVTASTGTVIGKALDKATADGDLIRVLINI